jgi:anaerobic selenocysteine-containing dehydrogenase
VGVADGKILSVRGSREHPITQGFVCPRGRGDPQRVYSSERVLYPHVNQSGKWKRVGWGEALSQLTAKLQSARESGGQESVLLYDYPGNQGFLAWQFPQRVWQALGATTTDYSLCASSGRAAIGLHYGLSYGVQLEDLKEMKVITFWGNNAKVSASHHWALAARARKDRNAVVIAVDPRISSTAEGADIRLHPRPGTDVALAFGVAREVIVADGVDKRFIDEWTVGYEEFKREALSWTPDRVERVTGVNRKEIKAVADLYMSRRPAAFMIGLGLQKSSEGTEAVRAVALLPALLGYHRGFHYSNGQGRQMNWNDISGRGLAGRKGRVVSQVSLGKRLAAGEFRFVFVLGSNPAVTLPDQESVRQGLARGDVFVAVQDTHWSETARLGNLVLPAATYLEKTDVNLSDHHPYCRLSNKAVDPLGESRSEIDVMREIARRLKLSEPWLFEDPWQALATAFKGSFTDKSFDDLLNGEILELKSRRKAEYQTPSGRIEFFASRTSDTGAHGIPRQMECSENRDELTLLNSSLRNYTHSQFTDVYGPIPPLVWINEKDARATGIAAGDTVILCNERGEVPVKAVVNNKVGPGLLWAPRPLTGLDGTPLNILATGTAQKMWGGPEFGRLKVRLRKAAS